MKKVCQVKISSGWEQSIYVLLILSRLPKGKHINSLALSERLHVSHSYLKKTIKSLVKEGLVKSSPGKLGGFSLAIRSEERRVGKEGRARGGAVQGKTKMGKGQAEGGRVGNG